MGWKGHTVLPWADECVSHSTLGKCPASQWGHKCCVFISQITAELCISSLSWSVSSRCRAAGRWEQRGPEQLSQWGSLWDVRDKKNPRGAGEETEQGL